MPEHLTKPSFIRRLVASILILFVVFILLLIVTDFITDWWWFSEVGYTQIFIKSTGTKLALFLAAVIFTAVFLLTNFFLAIRSKVAWTAALPEALIGRPLGLDNRIVKKLAVVFSLVIALFLGLVATASWQEVLKFISATAFGSIDPIFNKDIGFYIFSLPVFQAGLGLGKAIIILTLIGCIIIYFLRGSISVASLRAFKQMQVERSARIHLGILFTIFFATVAIEPYLSRFTMISGHQDAFQFGASYIDANVKVPMMWLSMITAVFAAVSSVLWAWKQKLSPFIGAIALGVVVVLGSAIVPYIVQKLIVVPNELVKETPFINYNITATRQAFAFDKIEEQVILGDKPITTAAISSGNLTVKNIQLWDNKPLLSIFSQIQAVKNYYQFAEVDSDRYIINGEIRQIMLSPRELVSAKLPNRKWINERLIFTHGYGVVAGSVNQVTPEGFPTFFVKDLPPKSDVKELELSRPEIYFGELSNDYVITKTKSREFDYPNGKGNIYTTYKGAGGVKINSVLQRVFYALKFFSLNILFSKEITTGESRILYYRNIADRIAKIAPFLTLDKDPYAVIADGKMYWIADAYTTSDSYPYSQPVSLNEDNDERVNYIRNSVKVVVDAYNGSVVFYQSDTEDPIIKTYAKIFPDTFRPLSEMPKSLVPHLRYPQDIFTMQSATYTAYHIKDLQSFYSKDDQWEIPVIAIEGNESIQPQHIIMKLPGEEKEEYVLMLPFTTQAKDNLSALLVARNDGESYGKLLVYRFPKDQFVFGPKQIIGRINQIPEITLQTSMWNQEGGSQQVIQGSLVIIPIEGALLYVRPLYLQSEVGKIPELKRVIVAYEDKIVMEATLEKGLAKIFGSGTQENTTTTTQLTPTQYYIQEERMRRAAEVYEEALQAQSAGNFSRYGEAIKLLGEILKQ